jgi:tetratricopeptide (TPR) repeat protein
MKPVALSVLAIGAFAMIALPVPALPDPNPLSSASLSANIEAERDWLFEALRTAPTEEQGRAIEDQIWRFWMRQAPDETSAEIMALAMDRKRWYDFAGAIEHLDRLIEHAPQWSEAWNQRAAVAFFQENYERSLADAARVLEMEPMHFGALAGRAVILSRQGRIELGQRALRQAVEIHPWLKERWMLLPGPLPSGHKL